MEYRILADVAMTAHFLFLVYLVVGGFAAWRWPGTWFAHAAVAVYGLVITLYGFTCPLTPLEHDFRRRAGQEGLEPTGFIDTYIEGIVYPERYAAAAQWAAAAVIAISWVGLLVKRHRRRQAAATSSRGAETSAR
ncbi:DUF2784 domain-containing protein [Glycomyces albus]